MLDDTPSSKAQSPERFGGPTTRRTGWRGLHDRVIAILALLPPLRRTLTAEGQPRPTRVMLRDVAVALVWGAICHIIFAAAVLAMILGMWFGMTAAFGQVPQPWAWVANVARLLQIPVSHSLLLTRRGRAWLSRLAPGDRGATLATTTFAIIASVQLLALFALWTPSGIVWWEATGVALWLIGALAVVAWGLLIKASWDAGAEVQSGVLGWLSLFRGVKPQFPPMPTTGLFRIVRQPIYVSFALTTWLVPVWTPDQLLVAVTLTAYCLIGPLYKERRFAKMFGANWDAYKAGRPYWVPRLWR